MSILSKGIPVGTRVRISGRPGQQGVVIGRYGGVMDTHVVLIAGERHPVARRDIVEDRLAGVTAWTHLRRGA